VGGFFGVFHEIFLKYKEGNQYKVTAASVVILEVEDTHPLQAFVFLSSYH
jgi:hypothetical protein